MSLPRWPLHPVPRPGEALSSWLARVAAAYGMQLEELADIDLGLPGLGRKPWESTGADLLDIDPPAAVLDRVHQRSGVPLAQLRLMSVAGWTPWFTDSLDPGLPEAFATYVGQDSVLFAAYDLKKPEPRHHPWRPWLPPEPRPRLRRACLPCVSSDGWWSLLMGNMPVMLSCPQHGTPLAPAGQVRAAAAGYGGEDDVPERAVEAVTVMDRRTHDGVTTGVVTLPRRSVHVGVWFRILRRVLHEVTTPVSYLRTIAAQQTLSFIWETAGRPRRAGQGRWAPFEAMDWKRQSVMLEGAAVAMHLAETGAITARGTLGHLLLPEPDEPVGSSPVRPDPWEVFFSDYRAILDAAISDRAASIELLRLLTGRCRTRGGYERARSDLIKCGLRAQYLPAWPSGGDRPDLDAAMAAACAAATDTRNAEEARPVRSGPLRA